MRQAGVDPGIPLTRLEQGAVPMVPSPSDHVLLVAVTEVNAPESLERYVSTARDMLRAFAAVPSPTKAAP
jgi:hypothetical protein